MRVALASISSWNCKYFQILLTLINFRLKHPNIVALLEVFEDKTKVFLVMELWVTQWMCFQFFWLFCYLSVGVASFSRLNSFFSFSPVFVSGILIDFQFCFVMFVWSFISRSYFTRVFSGWREASCLTGLWRRGHIPRRMQQILLNRCEEEILNHFHNPMLRLFRCCLQWPTCMAKG